MFLGDRVTNGQELPWAKHSSATASELAVIGRHAWYVQIDPREI